VTDQWGNPLAGSASASWYRANNFSASLSQYTDWCGCDQVAIYFTENVNSLDVSAFSLYYDGYSASLSGAWVSGYGTSWTLNLGSSSSSQGSYMLVLNSNSVTNSMGYHLNSDATVYWWRW
jgi:hypothetical protein